MMGGSKNSRRGIALADLLLVMVIVVMVPFIWVKAQDFQSARYRRLCYDSQVEAEKLMWEILYEKGKEVPQITSGYILREPDGTGKMILTFLPGKGENFPERVVVDLEERHFVGGRVCPLHRKLSEDQPVIDYWYGAGRWWCLFNEFHD